MHAIIAGANKAGTTSLFRYLSAHPAVCASRRKETDFFREDRPATPATRRQFEALFPADCAEGSLRLEASPSYLRGGAEVAARIHALLPDARLLFLLREPAERCLSYLRVNRENVYDPVVAGLAPEVFVGYVEQVSRAGHPPAPGPQRNAWNQYRRGCYAQDLEAYLEYFSPAQMWIGFFDDLRVDARGLTQRAAAFAGLDPDFYQHHEFAVENRTRQHRSGGLQQLAWRVNRTVEPLLNRFPAVRRGLRRVYEAVNERSDADLRAPGAPPADLRQRLARVYAPRNAELASLLTERFGLDDMPGWVRAQTSEGAAA